MSNQGSARDQPSTSASGLLSTLAPTALIAAVYVTIFLILRRSQKRWYAPRTYLGNLRSQERSPELPSGLFSWINPFRKTPDTFVLQHQSLDAYLFLRFLKMTVVIPFVGLLLTWPILFPINATGHGPKKQLDILSMSNVKTTSQSGKNRFFAHCFVGWLFFGFVLMLITRESIYYINLRQAFLLSPAYANRISSRTVLFTSVPKNYLDQAKLRKIFGDQVKRIWIVADSSKLDELVEERDKVAYKLEGAEVKLIKMAHQARMKAIKSGATSETEPLPEADTESASIAGRWVPKKKWPTHRLGKFGLYGKKVETIEWARERLSTLIPEVEAAQREYMAGNTEKTGGVFIEFFTQAEAQSAYQSVAHHQALHMCPRYIGIKPDEVVWPSLKISWWQRVVRRIVVMGFISALIIFWAIPVAVVGIISNISYLEQVSWLTWLKKIPNVIMGVITGLLPAVALSILMSLVPIVMRLCAKKAGEPSAARVELFTQNAYFAFQVLQVFLITTVASSIASVIDTLIHNPVGVTSLLASNLPTASNFYISYFLVQGLTISSGVISQVVGFFIFKILYKFLASTPRKMYQKWSSLSAISWGSTLPVYTNIAVIAITYSCIAPLVLFFATCGMGLFYLAYRYNILYVTDASIDTKGLIYPRALQQLMVGVYLAELCMIGLFAIATAIGPLILMIAFLVFTVLYHYSLNSALSPLFHTLPKTLMAEEDMVPVEHDLAMQTTPNEKNGYSTSKDGVLPPTEKKPNIITKFFKPHVYDSYHQLQKLVVPHGLVDTDDLYTEEVARDAYFPPSATSDAPLLWIPRDEAGVSRQEMSLTGRVIPITDDGASLEGEKGKIVWDMEGARPPVWREKIYY
ncbi:hypothetical protein F5884DRAFT_393902 [Xylogone sp. PMI_703]|nr:hypothetical protein F5884DRAFT_393902 [Xylogone sp. PMI_703]